jgi:hypothetical protein
MFWVVTTEDTHRVLGEKKPNQRVNRIPGIRLNPSKTVVISTEEITPGVMAGSFS